MPVVIVPADSELLRARAYALRHTVFVLEQAVPAELERDALDEEALHLVALDGERCVGTGRLVRQARGVGRVGRMAVDRAHRHAGVGARLLGALEERARAEGLVEIELHAQCRAATFYEREGYAPEGEEFVEAGIPHLVMRKRL
jgi:predicted GNAT family N-acyltransferase